MNTFNNDEQIIYNAFSQIEVDSSNISNGVKERLHSDAPQRRRIRKPAVLAVAAAASLLMVISVAAATGSFDWLLQKLNPSYGSIIEPVQSYADDQGIRMEVIGAKNYGSNAVIYVSLQDISGEKRITENTLIDYKGYLSIATAPVDSGADEETISFSCGVGTIYYDEENSLIVNEITVYSEPQLADPMTISTNLIALDKTEYINEPIEVNLTEFANSEEIAITEDYVWAGGINNDMSWERYFEIISSTLMPNELNIPVAPNANSKLISNIGIIDGQLHIQICADSSDDSGVLGSILLVNEDDERAYSGYHYTMFADKDYNLLRKSTEDGSNFQYRLEEYVYDIDVNSLDKYSIVFDGSVYSTVEGNWKVTANLSGNAAGDIVTATNDISIEGILFSDISINPLGMLANGRFENIDVVLDNFTIAVETRRGLLYLDSPGGSCDDEGNFCYYWQFDEAIDTAEVTAVWVNDLRIPVE